jgi:protocatechuate 3,4-dioxygenase beta subunit
MKILRLFVMSVSVTLALSLFTVANAAQKVQSIIRRLSDPEAQANTNAAKVIHCAGTVVDADGKPLAGAVVASYQFANGGWAVGGAEIEERQRVTTGTNGVFELQVPSGYTFLLARKAGLAPAWKQFSNPTKDLTEERLVCTPPTTLAGMVVDETEKPVGNAEVWVSFACSIGLREDGSMSYAYASGKPLQECFSVRTAADGKFVIQGFPTNAAADLAVRMSGKVLRELPRDSVGPDTMRCRSGQQDIKLIVEPAGSVEGKVVVQETGQPLAGMRLSLDGVRPGSVRSGNREPGESRADGTFLMPDVAAGSYQIHARFGTNPVPEWVAETVPVTVEAGQATRDVRVSASRGGFLEVAVVGKGDRKPFAAAGINAYREGYQAGASSDTNGIALLRLPPGEYQVSAYGEKARSEATAATVALGQTNRIEIELSPPPRITGVVRDPSGAAVAGLQLLLSPNWGHNEGEIKTDAKGRYELTWDPQRFGGSQQTFCLVARDVERNLATVQELEEGKTTLDLRLETGLVVSGRVEDVNGKPLSNATVRVFLWSGNSGSQFGDKPIKADAQGHFEITALPPGRKYSLDATAKGYGSANQNIPADSETNRIEVAPCVLKVADHKLAGEVVDADDKPVAQAYVHMYGQGQPNGSVRTDDKGRFKFDEVCEGSVQLSASTRGPYGSARAEAGDTNVVIRLGVNQSVSSRAAPKRPSLKGKPLPDLAAVDLSGDAAPAGKPILLCLFDIEQRPSRRFVRQLTEQHDALRQKGLTVLGLQAAVTTAESFKEWKDATPVPFPVGRLAAKADKTKWASDVTSFPWLILTDGQHRVAAEGFALDELEAKLKAVAK